MRRTAAILVPAVDVDRILIDHFLKGWELGVIARVMEIGPAVMSRLVKTKHRSITVWAKQRALPRIEMGADNHSGYKWVALDGDGRMVAEGNRQAPLFRQVLRLLKGQGINPEHYIRGIYTP
jgi:hypothetical protein